MQDRIADELMRDDLTSQISIAVSDAINIYQKEQFRFNETFTASFQTVVGQQNYNTLTDPNFPNLTNTTQFFHIAWVTLTVPPAVFDLPRIAPEQLLVLTQTGTQMGQPYTYAFMDETIMLYPLPSSGGPGQIGGFNQLAVGTSYPNGVYTNTSLTGGAGNSATGNFTIVGGQVFAFQLLNPGVNYNVGDILTCTALTPGTGWQIQVTSLFSNTQGPYKVTVGGHIAYAAPTDPAATGNRWMTDGERLIRSRAKYQLASHVTRNLQMAQMMSPQEPAPGAAPGATWEAYRELKVEAVRMARRGVLTPMYFTTTLGFVSDIVWRIVEAISYALPGRV
jgi:hypothetical protein